MGHMLQHDRILQKKDAMQKYKRKKTDSAGRRHFPGKPGLARVFPQFPVSIELHPQHPNGICQTLHIPRQNLTSPLPIAWHTGRKDARQKYKRKKMDSAGRRHFTGKRGLFLIPSLHQYPSQHPREMQNSAYPRQNFTSSPPPLVAPPAPPISINTQRLPQSASIPPPLNTSKSL